MKRNFILILFISIFLTFFSSAIFALNPFITHVYTADPTARVFEGRVYVYASHDKDEAGEYDMDDYHVFSSADMKNWVDHGVVFSYKDLSPMVTHPDGTVSYGWVEAPTGTGKDWFDRRPCFWAPDCVYKNGTYYLYYPAQDYDVPPTKDSKNKWRWDQFKIGVATSNSPCGPFVPYNYPAGTQDPYGNTTNPSTGKLYEGQIYIPGSYSIDPVVLVDDDGKVYMLYGGNQYGGINDQKVADGDVPAYIGDIGTGPRIAQLNPTTMADFITQPREIHIVDINGVNNDADYYEGPWIHKRTNPSDSKTWYYLSYPNPIGSSGSEMHYAMAEKPAGIDLDNTSIVWKTPNDSITSSGTNRIIPGVGSGMTNHGSVVEYKGDWYVFYHNANLSVGGLRKRSICVDRLNYNTDGTIIESSITTAGVGISAYYKIKAQFSTLNGVDNNEDCGGGDIGKCVTNIHNGDSISIANVDFGTIGAGTFVAEAASNYSAGAKGGNIEVYLDSSTTPIGTVAVGDTNNWHGWKDIYCYLNPALTRGVHNIVLKFVNTSSGSNYLFNLNWFKFIQAENIPVGHSVALKSLNPNCIPSGGGTAGQQYLSVYGTNFRVQVDQPAITSANEKFSILDFNQSVTTSGLIQLNSSNNGKNLLRSTQRVVANGGDYKGLVTGDSFRYENNYDGTMSLYNTYRTKYMCIDTTQGNNPANAYLNKDTALTASEKYYCEVQDAPIGCIVVFKSLNPACSSNPYLCIDSDNNEDLCVNRSLAIGDWEKFVVTDANNGYIGLRSYNTGEYLRFADTSSPGKTEGSAPANSDRFQWRNNGDGTISLFNVGLGQYLCVDTSKGTNPAKVYANKPAAAGDWEKFYCQITALTKQHFKNVDGKVLTRHDHSIEVLAQDSHYWEGIPEDQFWLSQSWAVESISHDYVRIKNVWKGDYLTAVNNSDYSLVECQSMNDSLNLQHWVMERTNDGRVRLKNVGSGRYLTVGSATNGDGINVITCQPLNDWTSQIWINE